MSGGPDRFILAQGSMDGACFLYSVANAAKALTGSKRLSAQQWSDMLKSLKRADDFMDQQIGTANSDPSPQQQVGTIRQMVKVLAPSREISVSLIGADSMSGKRLAALMGPQTVLVVGTPEHWVCAVDVEREGRNLLVADSSQLHETKHYSEQADGQFGRVWNNRWSAAAQKSYFRAFRMDVC